MMLVLITYDVNISSEGGQKRLRHIAKTCLDYGVRVQNSVFECEVDPAQYAHLQAKLLKLYNPEGDSLRFYRLGKKGKNRVDHFGAKQVQNPLTDNLIL